MSFPKSLKVCIAALMMPFRSSPATARAERRLNRHTPTPALLLTGIMAAGIAVALPMHAAAQEPATSPDSDATASAQNGAQLSHKACHTGKQRSHTNLQVPGDSEIVCSL